MRVCLVSRELTPYWGAGIGTYAANMLRAWREQGHDAHVITDPHPGLGPSATVHLRPARHEPEDFERCARDTAELLAALHARHPFDYVEFPDYWGEGSASIARRAAPRPAVLGVRLHSPTALCRRLNREGRGAPAVRRLVALESASIAGADVLISPTRSLLDWTRRHVPGAGVVPGGVVPYPFHADIPAGEPATPDPSLVLFFGRLERRKGVQVLIDAARRLHRRGLRARFRLIGGDTRTGPRRGSMLEYLRARARGLEVEFVPAIPRARLGSQIRAAAVCVFPSLWENFPNAVLEAMALGACVIGSDRGGMAEIIEPGASGLIARAGSARSLARAIARAFKDPPLRDRIAAAAPARVRDLCDPARVVASTVELIRARAAC